MRPYIPCMDVSLLKPSLMLLPSSPSFGSGLYELSCIEPLIIAYVCSFYESCSYLTVACAESPCRYYICMLMYWNISSTCIILRYELDS